MKLGVQKLSTLQDFGMYDSLTDAMSEYHDFFRDKVNENKNKIVTSFINRDFDAIWSIMQENKKYEDSGFPMVLALNKTMLKFNRYVTQPTMVHQIFNKSFDHIEEIADSDTFYK